MTEKSCNFHTVPLISRIFYVFSFEIIRCDQCGASAVHIHCGKLKRKAPYYVCSNHEKAEEDMAKHLKETREIMAARDEDISDDDCPIDYKHLIKDSTSSNSQRPNKPGPLSKKR